MCTYVTTTIAVEGSAKGPKGWFPARRASVYHDHPVATVAEHTLNIDVLSGDSPAERVAIELTPAAARDLAAAIIRTLEAGTEPAAR